MKIPSEFDDIRPFEEDELPAVYERLLSNEQFKAVIKFLYPEVPFDTVAQRMRQCKTNMEFQLAFCYTFLNKILSKASKGIEMDASCIDNSKCYTFISNHRDIVLDSAILDKLLIDEKFTTTCEIAIGDNLLSLPWVLDIVRVNKSFIVKRGLLARERMASSIKLSKYMHYTIKEKKESLWIAQREGRAKNSDDRTQKAVLKMLALGNDTSTLDSLQQLHIVPLSISYEYDPCDYLKAAEAQAKRDNPNWKKGPMDDVVSMQTGIMGYKGYIHYYAAPCIDKYIESLKLIKEPTSQLLDRICQYIDYEIHKNYKLYPINYIAIDELMGAKEFASNYTEADKKIVLNYIQSQLNKIEIPNKDEKFLRKTILEMYANPAINYIKANEKHHS